MLSPKDKAEYIAHLESFKLRLYEVVRCISVHHIAEISDVHQEPSSQKNFGYDMEEVLFFYASLCRDLEAALEID